MDSSWRFSCRLMNWKQQTGFMSFKLLGIFDLWLNCEKVSGGSCNKLRIITTMKSLLIAPCWHSVLEAFVISGLLIEAGNSRIGRPTLPFLNARSRVSHESNFWVTRTRRVTTRESEVKTISPRWLGLVQCKSQNPRNRNSCVHVLMLHDTCRNSDSWLESWLHNNTHCKCWMN